MNSETKQRLASMRANRRQASTRAKEEIECVEANVDFIEQLTDEFSWYPVKYWNEPAYISATIYCETEEAVKEACRLARSLLGCKSEKELNPNSGTMSYYHRKGSEDNDSLRGNSIEVHGGSVTPGCKLIAETEWSEPRKYTTYRMECGK